MKVVLTRFLFKKIFIVVYFYKGFLFRHSAVGFPTLPKCGHNEESKSGFSCFRLNMQDVRRFHQGFYRTNIKVEQDQYILRFAKGKLPKRHRLQTPDSTERGMTIEYCMPTYRVEKGSEEIKVCQKTFLDTLNISKFRVQRLCRKAFLTGASPKEVRGGDHRSHKSEEKLAAIKRFIESIKTIESHYCRGKSKRQYLPSHLSINSLWAAYNKSVENDEQLQVKYEYFRKVFVENYNVGFGSPATDKCSKCLELDEKIKKSAADQEQQNAFKVELAVHKKRGKKFFELLREDEPNTITFSFDCQKNLIFPKLPDQAAYFLRQFYVYNFTVCQGSSHSKQSPENTFIYTWTEMEGEKGSSEIASSVRHCLSNTRFPENVDTIRMFADGAGGQNKNTIVVTALLNWLLQKAPNHIKKIALHYPVPGHSYIPPDRVFGVIERKVQKLESIIHPNEYIKIFSDSGTVIRVGLDFEVEDWKDASKSVVKPPNQWHFQFSKCKRFILSRGKNGLGLVRGEVSYSTNMGAAKVISKKGRRLDMMYPVSKPYAVPPKPKKLVDVKKLLDKHYGQDWSTLESLKYYKDLFDGAQGAAEPIADQDDGEGSDDEPMDDEVMILEGSFVL